MSAKIDREIKREFAKIGMTAPLGVAVLTAPLLKRNRRLKNLHTGAGLALAAANASAPEALPAPTADPAP